MGNQTLALAALASIIGHKHGIRVTFDPSASTASTDGKNLTLPVVTTLGSEDHAALITGLVDHEAMHIRHTDFDVLRKGNFSPLVRSLGNLIEDVWGEREQAVIYPGCARSIKESMVVMIKLGWYRGPTDDPEQPSMLFTNWLLHALLARWYKLPELETMAVAYRQKADAVFGADLSNQIWTKTLEVDGVKTTEAGHNLAQSLADLLQSAMKDQKQEQRNSSAIQQTVNAQSDDCAATDFGSRVCGALGAEGVAGPGNGQAEPKSVQGTASMSQRVEEDEDRQTQEDAEVLARPVIVGLGNKLDLLLQSKVEEHSEHRRHGRKLDTRRLAGIKLGKTDVYKHTDEEEGINTAVKLILDISGSMQANFDGMVIKDSPDRRILSAAAAIIAAGQVLERHSIPFSVDLFGSVVYEFKTFEQSWRKQRSNLMTFNGGSTNLYAALKTCLVQLLSRTEMRKQIILATDGDPNYAEEALAIMNLMRKHGIMFSIVFIGGSGRNFEMELKREGYPISRVNSHDALATSFFEALRNAF